MRAARPERLTRGLLASPLGPLRLFVDDAGAVRLLDFGEDGPRARRLMRIHHDGIPVRDGATPADVPDALERYFAGELAAPEDIPVRLAGTDFQRTVWRALLGIPAGETRTYAALAAAIGRPTAIRAVGLANGSNPVGIVVPCHRVIGSDGSLTGYGGGLERKRWLLAHEKAI